MGTVQSAINSAIDTTKSAIGVMKFFQNESIDSLSEGLAKKSDDLKDELDKNEESMDALKAERTKVETDAKETGKWIDPNTGKETTSRAFKYNNTRAQTRLLHDKDALEKSLNAVTDTRNAMYKAKSGSLFANASLIKEADKLLGGV